MLHVGHVSIYLVCRIRVERPCPWLKVQQLTVVMSSDLSPTRS